jgi:hypothetical protein
LKGGQVVSCGHVSQSGMGGGGLAADGVRTGGGSPYLAVPGHAREWQGKREKGESGGIDEWAGLEGGA